MYKSGSSATNSGINLPTSGAGITWGANYSRIYDDGDLQIYTDDNTHFKNSGGERMSIINNGNVGVGTTSPGALLNVKLGSSADSTGQVAGIFASIIYNATNTSAYNGLLCKLNWIGTAATVAEFGGDLVGGAYWSYYNINGVGAHTWGSYNRASSMTLTSGGNLSIGTTNSSAPLHVRGIVAGGINAFNYYNYTFPQAGVYTVILEYAQFSDTNIIDGWTVTVGNGNNPVVTYFSGNKGYLRANVVSQYVVGFGSANSLPGGYNNSNYNLRVAFLCAQ